MSALANALALDTAQDLPAAAREYERAVRDVGATLETYLNLAVLYFVLVDPGEASTRGLSADFVNAAWRRATELLEEASDRFGSNSEIEFWKRYFRFVVVGDAFLPEECEELAKSGGSLVPYFFLSSACDDNRYCEQTEVLREQVRARETARQRYVYDMLQKARGRSRQRSKS
ncbi:MAG: hypothetical protein Q8R92_11630 [Deltaproteobacteria bacterium]|nr:hypothetical protein [Deltaproteobacteria bacterium]